MPKLAETDLYPPIKLFLEAQGYTVKAEVGAADVVAMRGDEDPVIVELKTGFSLALFHQAIERLALTNTVYIAVPRPGKTSRSKAFRANRKLCRRLGLGLLLVRLTDGHVEPLEDPRPYQPRKSKAKRGRLLKEFASRIGDPNLGGTTRQTLVTAYRQDALRCLGFLETCGQAKASIVSAETGVTRARTIMSDNHYGWFERVERGIYTISPKGRDAIAEHAASLEQLRGSKIS